MITKEQIINPLKPKQSAIKTAIECYRKWNGSINFRSDVADYLESGFVMSRPDMFWMAKIIDLSGEPAWFVRMAVGNLKDLLDTLPCYLNKISFCRKQDGRLRVYSLDKLLKKVRKPCFAKATQGIGGK